MCISGLEKNEEEEKKTKAMSNQNRRTTQITERLVALAGKKAAEKEAMKGNQKKVPFTFALQANTKKKLTKNVPVKNVLDESPEHEDEIIRISQEDYDELYTKCFF